jgi:hypothetical protein
LADLEIGRMVLRFHLAGEPFVERVGRGQRYGSFAVSSKFLNEVTASSHFTVAVVDDT